MDTGRSEGAGMALPSSAGIAKASAGKRASEQVDELIVHGGFQSMRA